jgi:hypothetical protein
MSHGFLVLGISLAYPHQQQRENQRNTADHCTTTGKENNA